MYLSVQNRLCKRRLVTVLLSRIPSKNLKYTVSLTNSTNSDINFFFYLFNFKKRTAQSINLILKNIAVQNNFLKFQQFLSKNKRSLFACLQMKILEKNNPFIALYCKKMKRISQKGIGSIFVSFNKKQQKIQ
ncbi:hypothetical protein TTHERM_01132910 (macronuclear) [Tetrahymena thermophila SB210]|uniref:Uncharacterized protein n=1 Tax=Tetrahymena thermophila (strain SB210) TaxID=312017 RepID=Q24HU1_TETTS|nr:hypothetical protein TTHERM_01132910 [Tetrahymena thermophila SB210]EAS07346.2 hypothetical protein TTHERM_01132910 [Tetrahymena thermophila SB210]|eukprot:XP_001027588.2 hypothetical protein TTHERM_01132910 [Tetrahymena thermophila SB210]